MDRRPPAALFDLLAEIGTRPALYSRITTASLWTDPHISARMLRCHLDVDLDAASYRLAFVEASVRWIRERFALGPGRSVADFGCGPGLYTNRLALTGAAVTGIDIASGSLAHARGASVAGPVPVRYLHRDYLSYAEPVRYDLIILIMRDFGALPPADRARLMGVVRAQLAPAGLLLFDVDSLAAFGRVRERAEYGPDLMDGFFSPQAYFGFHHTYRYEPEAVSLDRYEIVLRAGRRSYFDWVRYYDPGSLAAELAGAGFEVRDLLGDVAGAAYDPAAPQFAVICGVH